FVVGDTCDITWLADDNIGVESISILYSIDAGISWDTIATGEPNDSLYEWVIPNTPSDSCLVKILAYDPSLNIGEDQSDSYFSISSGVGIEENISSPVSFARLQIKPNPFNEKVEIELGMQDVGCKMEDISLQIFDVTGRKVREISLLPFNFSLGATWDGKNDHGRRLPSGIYYCRLSQGSYTETRKILFMK
ncbi:T9SS type A sorting domain-containing protein, partial [candidate division WOR-3 bacterium]|nr:T9SS type A sorting domain-containing protein [candidate division WOR-3 bacterium]